MKNVLVVELLYAMREHRADSKSEYMTLAARGKKYADDVTFFFFSSPSDGAGEASGIACPADAPLPALRPADDEDCVDCIGRLIDPTRSFSVQCAIEIRGRDFTTDFFSTHGHRPGIKQKQMNVALCFALLYFPT